MKKLLLLTALLASITLQANDTAQILLDATDIASAYITTTIKRTSVHDPSIAVRQTGTKYYFVFGSHMGVSRSSDLQNWNAMFYETTTSTLFSSAYTTAFRTNKTTTVKVLSGNDTINATFGNFDASAWNTALDNYTVAGNMWAPDVIYNPTMGKYCMYLSLNGSKWNSCIILLTASAINGPYTYQGPVIFSGFNATATDAISYTKTDFSLVLPQYSSLPSRYNRSSSWGNYWPHCIDPCVFYDDDDQLWMVYGSWSGGLYILQLDETTGLRDYTVTYPITGSAQGVTSDPYFGKKIGGGYYVSGEGAYVEKIGNYYYLFVSYGFYSPNGGYEMRVFRSSSPDGPYKDASSNSAIYTAYQMNYGLKAATNRGMKLFGSYQWDLMPVAEIAQGHNSALVDTDGNAYVVYHTKFNDGTVGHQVRVHQLFVNEKGWLTAAPYEYSGEKINTDSIAAKCYFDSSEIVGEYQFMLHPYKVNYENYAYSKPSLVQLNANGTVTGAYSGSWALTEGTSYIRLTLSGTSYYGCLVNQTIDLTNIRALCITASSPAGVSLWASKADSKAVVAMNYNILSPNFANGDVVSENLNLPTSVLLGGKTTWQSSNEAVISTKGVVDAMSEDTQVTLTAVLSHGDYYAQKSYTLTVKGDPTAIHTVKTTPAVHEIYDVFGRPVEEPLTRGLYLINGEKVFLK